MAIRKSSISGTPFGGTSDRPSSPVKGQTFYNGDLGILEIYTGTQWVANNAPTSPPTIGTATNVGTSRAYNNGSATVTFTAGSTGGLPNSYTVTSSPGGYTATGSSSPITVTGLQSNTAYTFTATSTNNFGTSSASSASNSITATTVPQAPTITSVSQTALTSVSVAFSAGATGGSAITGYTVTSNTGGFTGTGASSPITVSGLTAGGTYTFTVTATNANGTSSASSASKEHKHSATHD